MSEPQVIDQQVITEFVVEELGKGRDRRDVIFEMCEKLGWSWPQAENFVVTVEHTAKNKIAQKQLPILLILGVGILIGGIGLFGYGMLRLLNGSVLSTYTYVALATGLGMICGGIFGTWKALMTSAGRE